MMIWNKKMNSQGRTEGKNYQIKAVKAKFKNFWVHFRVIFQVNFRTISRWPIDRRSFWCHFLESWWWNQLEWFDRVTQGHSRSFCSHVMTFDSSKTWTKLKLACLIYQHYENSLSMAVSKSKFSNHNLLSTNSTGNLTGSWTDSKKNFKVMNYHHFLHCVGVWAVADSWPLFGHLWFYSFACYALLSLLQVKTRQSKSITVNLKFGQTWDLRWRKVMLNL